MNKPTWNIILSDGSQKYIQCDLIGVANNGELLCFEANQNMPQPMAIMGWAASEWKSFAKSNIALQ